ncbi:MAG: delta-60 repeat domain-containing protein, partial [Dokdonella sp.]
FSTIGGQTRNFIARLNVDGSADTAFNANANGSVYALALQPDGKLVVGGFFTTIGGQPRNGIARLNTDGSADPTFNPNANKGVFALAAQPDGKVLVGGEFTTIGGQARNYIARLSSPTTALQSLTVSSTFPTGAYLVIWTRSGAGPALALPPQLLFSLDGSTYGTVGIMEPTYSGWRYDGFVPPLGVNFYLRTRGQVASGMGGESSGLIESTRQVYLSLGDRIFANGFD